MNGSGTPVGGTLPDTTCYCTNNPLFSMIFTRICVFWRKKRENISVLSKLKYIRGGICKMKFNECLSILQIYNILLYQIYWANKFCLPELF